MPRIRKLAVLAAIPWLGACAFNMPIRPSLEGSRWQITKINDTAVPATPSYQVTFERGRMSGRLGCNYFNAEYVLEPEYMRFGRADATRMLCGDQSMAHEEAGFAAIRQAARILWTDLGSRLVLTSTGGSLDLKRIP